MSQTTACLALCCAAIALTHALPLYAQDEADGSLGDEDRVVIDLTLPKPADKLDTLAAKQCGDEADAARIRGEIVVCAKPLETTDGSWDKSDWEKRYAERTQGPKPLNMYVDPTPPMVGITLTAKFGAPPGSAPVLIDVEALPEAAKGSDADRIARGLPALGQDEALSEELLKHRQEALDLPPSQYEGQP